MIDHAHRITLAARLADQQAAHSQDHSLPDQQVAHSQDQLLDQRQQVQQLDPPQVAQSLALKMLSHQRRALRS